MGGRALKLLLVSCLFGGLVVHSAGGAVAAGPSFDCDKARGDVERLICADAELSDLDARFARSFAAALARAPAGAVRDLTASEKDWRRIRNNCARASDPRQCTMDAYQSFMSQL
ncbi:lysozyme inhibitor LprI family protein [Methylobrevis albus]|uniref:DUF1311 domain-containing protein n=1 Tax=Methylobrevis albus TaxID=2793297 RepID=A0A931I2S5_9HYPH|nr:lysozyme inhibitor LprI family protein [Methylobrevis albus]MBH0238216.1 DUF1311 domain-containing protein [Methylobrevis albus]